MTPPPGATAPDPRVAPRHRQPPSPARAFAPPRDLAGAAALLALLVALALGGSQQRPLGLMTVELVAVVALAARVATADRRIWRDARPAALAAVLAVLVLAAEAVPLPYRVWAGLPGHGLAAGARAVAGLGPQPLPLSLDPYATVDAMLVLLPGLAMFAAGLTADRREARTLAGCVVLAAVASTLLGMLQLGGGQDLYLYPETQLGYAVGFFSNRNQQADLLLVAILVVAGLAREVRGVRPAGGVCAVLLAAGVVATGSRTGLLLLAPVLLAAFGIVILRARRGLPALIGGATVAILGLAALSVFSPVAARAFARYQTVAGDLRFDLWTDTMFAVRQYWPTGSGLGTFQTVYATVEPLDRVMRTHVNHAHDDYLELLLELGLGGAVLIVGYAIVLGWALVRNARAGATAQAAAGMAILVLLAHSLVDYPLRMPALMAVFGLLNGLVLRAPPRAGAP